MQELDPIQIGKDIDRIIEVASSARSQLIASENLEANISTSLNEIVSIVNAIEKTIPGCRPPLFEAERLTDEILDVILAYSTLDFSPTVQISFEDSNFNAVAAGLNMLGQEFARDIARREKAEESLKHAKEEVEKSNQELESFSYSVAHDLRAPLRTMMGFSGALLEDHGDSLNAEAKENLMRVVNAARKMGQLIDGLLELSRLARREIVKSVVDLTGLSHDIIADLKNEQPARHVALEIAENMTVRGDQVLLKAALTNLLRNAWKFTSKQPQAKIIFGIDRREVQTIYFIKDNGAGFDMQYSNKLFGAFQRFHSANEFEGTGIGLATTKRIIQKHGGSIWAEAAPGQGATFFFTL